MPLSTYTELKAEIAAWLLRDNLTARIPTFIQLCEERIKRNLRVREMLQETNLSVTAASPVVSLPSGFLQMRNLRISGSTANSPVLQLRPAAALRDENTASGTPRFYAYNDTTLLLSPTPSAAMTLIAEAYIMPTALSDSNAANTILLNYPSLYLQGSLAEGFRYLRNRERLEESEAAFSTSLNDANLASRKLMASGVSAPMTAFKRNVP